MPALLARHQARESARQLAFDAPWSALILLVLETAAYRQHTVHPRGWIAARLGIDEETVARCLQRLVDAGVLQFDGENYRSTESLSVDTHVGSEKLNALKGHWIDVAQSRLVHPGAGDLFFYNLVSLSVADLDRIRALQRAYFRELRSIVAASEPCETVALINLQLIEWPLEQ